MNFVILLFIPDLRVRTIVIHFEKLKNLINHLKNLNAGGIIGSRIAVYKWHHSTTKEKVSIVSNEEQRQSSNQNFLTTQTCGFG